MDDLVFVPHGQCSNCGHAGALIDVTVFTVMGYRPGKGCDKCHQTGMSRRWMVEKPAPEQALDQLTSTD
ncbi:hypothetical protein AU099_gp63 [Gordonia phage GTE8]|uniref:Uncharacterized protein n=1 Tax=Gordonia phage GTE8 TaxID=1647475 RepID=A0A0K0N6Y5_9CAUD|nr:hypothetical protein AU099_gp63 [Gordonia phage GTE8]AKJ72406.1 hypothetical protein GTE8_63 [Gordonia phage GTE8]